MFRPVIRRVGKDDLGRQTHTFTDQHGNVWTVTRRHYQIPVSSWGYRLTSPTATDNEVYDTLAEVRDSFTIEDEEEA